jgi:hypothetical protein
MPRDSSGIYTLVTGNPVIKGEPIVASWANPTLDDIAAALTQSLDRYGNGGMLAPLVLSGAPTADTHAANKLYVDAKAWQEAPEDGLSYARRNVAWTPVVSFPEAPSDGQQYARRNAAWSQVPAPLDAYTKAETEARYVNVTGDSMSGALGVPDGTLAAHAVNKGQVDAADALKANLSGATFTGPVTAPNFTNSTTGGTVVDTTSIALRAFRNRIINGGLFVKQRILPAGATSVSGPGGYFTDRWAMWAAGTMASGNTAGAAYDVTDWVGSPYPGYMMYLQAVSAGTPGASDYWVVQQSIEASMLVGFKLGTADAKPMVLSFVAMCKPSMGQFVMSAGVRCGDLTRSCFSNFTVKPTPQRFVMQIPALTASFSDGANGMHLAVNFTVASGSGHVAATPGVWVSGSKLAAPGVGNLKAVAGDYVRITEVQLEEGTIATPFEYRPKATEEDLCRRYWEHLNVIGMRYIASGNYGGMVQNYIFRTLKRALPASTMYNGNDLTGSSGGLTINGSATSGSFNIVRQLGGFFLWNTGTPSALPNVGDYFEGSIAFDAEVS